MSPSHHRSPTDTEAAPLQTTHRFRALLLDVYGVLEFKGEACPGAVELIASLNRRGIPYRLLTNSTLQSRSSMAAKLNRIGIDVDAAHLVTASSATASWLKQRNAKSCRVIIDGKGLDEFDDLHLLPGLEPGKVLTEDEVPEYLVLGDARDGFIFANINVMYRQLMAGATLVSMIPNITSVEKTGAEITVGGYALMLETASAKPAVTIGKPARIMFDMALLELGVERHEALMVGDNEGVDVAGARGAGLASALIQTGEYAWPQLRSSSDPLRPEFLINHLDQLQELIV